MKNKWLAIVLTLGIGMTAILLLALDGSPPAAYGQGLDSHDTYYVALSCDGVPAPCYTTIQAAVDAADDPGDVIKVAAGIYGGVSARAGVTQVVYISKSLTLCGGYTVTNWTSPDPEANPTTLDAEGQGRVIYVAGEPNPPIPTATRTPSAPTRPRQPSRTIRVEGLRITGGDASGLGPESSWDFGGGLYVVTASVTLRNNRVFSNTADSGGGLLAFRSVITLSDSTVSSNTAGHGGGLALLDSRTVFSDNDVAGNSGRHGGGLDVYGSATVFDGNTIADNTARYNGGGLTLSGSDLTFDGTAVTGNSASMRSGGLEMGNCNATFVNSVIADNSSPDHGNGLYLWGSSLQMWHTTLSRNGGDDTSGLYATGGMGIYVVALTNTILTSHTTGIYATTGTVVTVNGALWYGNGANTGGGGTITVTNAITGDPGFVAPAAGDYHIGPGSAAIDAGVNGGTAIDIDGEARDPWPDLGADEGIKRLAGIEIVGPATGTVFTAYTFTTTVVPPTATLPVTFFWQAAGQPSVTHVLEDMNDVMTFTWGAAGTKAIAVSGTNAGDDIVSETFTITIEPAPWRLFSPVVFGNYP